MAEREPPLHCFACAEILYATREDGTFEIPVHLRCCRQPICQACLKECVNSTQTINGRLQDTGMNCPLCRHAFEPWVDRIELTEAISNTQQLSLDNQQLRTQVQQLQAQVQTLESENRRRLEDRARMTSRRDRHQARGASQGSGRPMAQAPGASQDSGLRSVTVDMGT